MPLIARSTSAVGASILGSGLGSASAGELFLESPAEIDRLNAVYDHLRTLSMSPAESVKLIKEHASGT
ncbi:Scr1 family TA system antitoxin-like transcriptional regulator [Fodinicola feengrottensis]|uniref:Scr1 family TA system antitoxin-like transcriptional regulator n=1 Tax=Fodinicola feengrottensis TaxID=435914 RepID=UPI0036F29D2F